ncbi:MAG: alpha/beta fold hydrolase [Anaerolineae bacterium]|nr:alpha/beta fold hydrolase [Anaerolineae bacterium]
MDEIWINIPSGKVHGMQAGAGPLVLALHGWSQRNGWHTWQPLLPPLAEAGYRAISVDMPGWGASPPLPAGQLHTESAVPVVVELLEALGVDAATLMGKSWGGGVALQTALDHPQRVANLILTAPAFKRLDRLGEIRQPVLLAWAEDDPVIPIRFARDYVMNVPQIALVTYETGGHSAAPKNAADFAPRAIAFLQQGNDD